MYERMNDKLNIPSEDEILSYIGKNSEELLMYFETLLSLRYDLTKELKFPFGNNYGWGYKYSKKSSHICHLFFERNSFTVLIQINGKGKEKIEQNISAFLPKTIEAWQNRYPCGEGGWIYYRAFSKEEIDDIIKLVEIKVKPQNNRLLN